MLNMAERATARSSIQKAASTVTKCQHLIDIKEFFQKNHIQRPSTAIIQL